MYFSIVLIAILLPLIGSLCELNKDVDDNDTLHSNSVFKLVKEVRTDIVSLSSNDTFTICSHNGKLIAKTKDGKTIEFNNSDIITHSNTSYYHIKRTYKVDTWYAYPCSFIDEKVYLPKKYITEDLVTLKSKE
jgi:hypothetical protein